MGIQLEGIRVSANILRNVATIPILAQLSRRPLPTPEIVERLRGIASERTVREGLKLLAHEGLVHFIVTSEPRLRKHYALTEAGNSLAAMRISDVRFGHSTDPQDSFHLEADTAHPFRFANLEAASSRGPPRPEPPKREEKTSPQEFNS